MPLDSLSEHERLRLAQLLKAPLIPPPKPPREHRRIRWPMWDHRMSDNRILLAARGHIRVDGRIGSIGGAAALGCLVLLAGIAGLSHRGPGAMILQLRESQGQVQIGWDTNSGLVRRATGAELYITDGAERLFVTLDKPRLERGMVSYAPQSGHVEFRMALTEPDGQTFEQKAVYLGAPQAEQGPPQMHARSEPAKPSPRIMATARPVELAGAIEHRSRRKPLNQTGTRLPFTCAPGDVFHKTDAPPGWDMFTCKVKNVWSVAPAQARDQRSTQRPNTNANTLTAKPASASTT